MKELPLTMVHLDVKNAHQVEKLEETWRQRIP